MIFEKQIAEGYMKTAYRRCDDEGDAFYFSAENFPGLSYEKYDFQSSLSHNLSGYLYSYENPKENRLIVFDHGFGGGHRSYMKEIETLCRHGYLVLAYDHTGCMESGGVNTNGMSQSLRDLNDCLRAVKSDSRFGGYEISVMGHSWGGFSTLNVSALHPELSHVVVLSGFVSVKELIKTFFPAILAPYRKAVMEIEQNANPDFVDFDATESLRSTRAKVLLIYSENDKLCTRVHFDALYKALSDKENIEFMLLKNKGHNPNYTESAVKYLGRYLKEKSKLKKKGKLNTNEQKELFVSSYDWNAMTEQDGDVWQKIFECLDN